MVTTLLQFVPQERQAHLSGFIVALFSLFKDLNFVYLEINPLVMTADNRITVLDMAAKIDETAHFLNAAQWGNIEFPAPFGRAEYPEEAFIKKLDQGSGSSLKLTILNQHGRIWTMVHQNDIVSCHCMLFGISDVSFVFCCCPGGRWRSIGRLCRHNR